MQRNATIVVSISLQNEIYPAFNTNWCVQYIVSHLSRVHDSFIVEIDEGYLQVAPFGSDICTQGVRSLFPDEEYSLD